MARFRFGDFELDDRRHELRRGGVVVPLEPKPMALLTMLVRNAERTISRSELLARLWPTVQVTDGSVSRAVSVLRTALGGPGERVVSTIRGAGYRIGVPVERLEDAAPASDFVGRKRELEAAERSIDAVLSGTSQLLLLAGEPGIGKTRLAGEIANRAAARGCEVHWGVAHEGQDAPPFWPWISILRSWADRRTPNEIADLPHAVLDELSALDPVLGEILAPSAPRAARPEVGPSQARFRRFDAVTTALRRGATRVPLMIVLDDLQWAGDESLLLWRFVASEIGPTPVIVLAIHRTASSQPDTSLAEAAAEVASHGHVGLASILGPLDDSAATGLVQAIAGERVPTGLVQTLRAWTNGNPLFLRELIELMPPGELTELPGGTVRESLRRAIERRLGRLSPSAREWIRLASVAGTSVPSELLVGRSVEPVGSPRTWVDEAIGQGILTEVRGGIRFSHDLLREIVYESLSASARMQLHAEFASLVESRHAGRLAPHHARLAHHYGRADPRAHGEDAVRHALAAAQVAREALAFDEAAGYYGDALETAGASLPPTRRADVLLDRADVGIASGAFMAAIQDLEEAAALARAARDRERLIRAALATTRVGDSLLGNPAAEALLQEGLEAMGPDDTARRVALEGALARQYQVSGRADEARLLLRRIVPAIETLADPRARLRARLDHLILVQHGEPLRPVSERLEVAEAVIREAQELGDVDAALHARRHRVSLQIQRGAPEALRAEAENLRRDSEAAGLRHHRHVAVAVAAGLAMLEGRFEEAARGIDEAEQLADPLDPTNRVFTPVTQRILLPASREDLEQRLATIEGVISRFPQVISWRVAPLWVLQDLDRREAARQLLAQVLENGPERLVFGHFGDPVVLASLIEACHWLDEPGHATALLKPLDALDGTFIQVGWGIACYGPLDYYRGLLQRLLGDRAAAVTRLESAIAQCEHMGARPWADRAQRALTRA